MVWNRFGLDRRKMTLWVPIAVSYGGMARMGSLRHGELRASDLVQLAEVVRVLARSGGTCPMLGKRCVGWAYSFGLSERFKEGIGQLCRREEKAIMTSLLL